MRGTGFIRCLALDIVFMEQAWNTLEQYLFHIFWASTCEHNTHGTGGTGSANFYEDI
jgi:hypothetical protein